MSEYMAHRRELKLGLVSKPKKEPKPIAKVSEKRKAEIAAEKDDKTMDEWFEARRKGMTGKCQHCGGKTTKDDDKLFKHSIAHILPKRPNMFPSVATHPDNWIELCFFGSSCHTNYDNNILDITDLNCFDQVIEKFERMFPAIDKKERRNIPGALMQYVNIDEV